MAMVARVILAIAIEDVTFIINYTFCDMNLLAPISLESMDGGAATGIST